VFPLPDVTPGDEALALKGEENATFTTEAEEVKGVYHDFGAEVARE